jgi:hypothetical protein
VRGFDALSNGEGQVEIEQAVAEKQKKTRPKALFYRYRVIFIRCAVAASTRA